MSRPTYVRYLCHHCGNRVELPSDSWLGRCHACRSQSTEVLWEGERGSGTSRGDDRNLRNGRTGHGGEGHNHVPSSELQIDEQLSSVLNTLRDILHLGHPGNPSLLHSFGNGGFITEDQFMEQIAARIMGAYEPVHIPTAARIRQKLPVYNVRPKGAEGEPGPTDACACAGESCTICYEEYSEGTTVVELPCSHCFHSPCIGPWLDTHNTCPVCRIELPREVQ